MEYDFRDMDVPKHPKGKELGCMILNPPFQKAAFRLIMKRCQDFGVSLLLLYPPAQFFAETAVTITEDKLRTQILNECQIRHLVIPKRVIFPGDKGKKNANVKVDWFRLDYKPGDARKRRDTKNFIDVDEWIAFVNEWTTKETARAAAAQTEKEAAYLRDVVNHVNQSDSQSEGEGEGEGETHTPPTDSVPMAEQKEDIPENQKQEKDVDDLADILDSTTINNQSDAPAPENARSTSMVSNMSSSSETSGQRFNHELADFGNGTPEHESTSYQYAAADDESVDMDAPDWMAPTSAPAPTQSVPMDEQDEADEMLADAMSSTTINEE